MMGSVGRKSHESIHS